MKGRRRKASLKRLIKLIITALILIYGVVTVTYAFAADENPPDMMMNIDSEGQVSLSGNLFGNDELWYPGQKKSGIIRINNQYKNVQISQLGLQVAINHFNHNYSQEIVNNSFLNQMKLSLARQKVLIFTENLFENKSIAELLYYPNDSESTGYQPVNLSLKKNDYIDLAYTLTMDEKAGDELESVTALVEVLVNFED